MPMGQCVKNQNEFQVRKSSMPQKHPKAKSSSCLICHSLAILPKPATLLPNCMVSSFDSVRPTRGAPEPLK